MGDHVNEGLPVRIDGIEDLHEPSKLIVGENRGTTPELASYVGREARRSVEQQRTSPNPHASPTMHVDRRAGMGNNKADGTACAGYRATPSF